MKKKIIFTIIAAKISIFVIIFLAFFLLPFNKIAHDLNFVNHHNEPISLASAFSTWDGQHYLYLSEQGYKKGIHPSNAFSPLFPFSIYLINFIIHNNLLAGLLSANIASFIGFYMFFLLVKKLYTEEIAYKSLLFLLAFPTSFYFSLIYSEALFFCLAVLFFYFLTEKKLLLASIAAFFLPFVRLFGMAIIFPFITYFFHEIHEVTLQTQVTTIGKKLLQKKILLVLSPILAFACTLLLMGKFTGNPFEQFAAQRYFIVQYSVLSFINPLNWIHVFLQWPLVIHGFTNSIIDRLFFVFFLLSLFFLYKKISFSFFVYALVIGVIPVLSGSFMSYTRHVIVVFPVFILLGIISTEKKWKPFVFPLIHIMLLLQGLFVVMQALNYWVA